MLVALAIFALVAPTGCVRRRLAVRSNPPGALVFVDNQQIGTTPCSVDFTYYGTREIRLVKPGYETLTVNQPIPMPWYQIPPVDFVSENLWPSEIQDHRTAAFNLQPQIIVPTEQLIERGNQLRQETLGSTAAVVPAGGPAPPLTPPPSFTPTPAPTMGVPVPGPTPLPPVGSPMQQISPPSTFSPTPLPGSQPASSPFSAPTLPAAPPAGTQQGPPIVSPPLR
jgi:hypothetical protein